MNVIKKYKKHVFYILVFWLILFLTYEYNVYKEKREQLKKIQKIHSLLLAEKNHSVIVCRSNKKETLLLRKYKVLAKNNKNYCIIYDRLRELFIDCDNCEVLQKIYKKKNKLYKEPI